MDLVWVIFLCFLGACIGSFLNVVIYRMPRGGSIFFPSRSYCPRCGNTIAWYDNIPIVSWLALRARCRACKAPISPRYILIELATAILVGGLFVCYYILRLRQGAGEFADTWPMFAAQAALLCGLLVCTMVDIETWTVPLEVCWFVTLVGVIAQTARPHPFVAPVSPNLGAAALGAGVGLVIAYVLMRLGFIQQSFLDVTNKPLSDPIDEKPQAATAGPAEATTTPAPKPKITSVAITREHGVNVRLEVLREVLFLTPAIVLAIAAYLLVTKVGPVRNFWHDLNSETAGGLFAGHFMGFQGAIVGYLVGGLWIWGTRIVGTLAFGKEAMGMGDVHILAAVGATLGWAGPSLAFFVAPLFGLIWALYLWMGRNQRELPYGPWLAGGTLIVMLGYDWFDKFLAPYTSLFAYGH